MKLNPNIKLLLLGLFCPLMLLLNISLGSVEIPFSTLAEVLMGQQPNSTHATIIWGFRLPRALSALFAGAGLASSGLLLQALFRNPLASPYVLGVSSGASLGVAVVVLASSLLGSLPVSVFFSNLSMLSGAIIGSMSVLLIILMIMKYIHDTITLLIIGLMISYLVSALVHILLYFSSAQEIELYVLWGMGSFAGISWTQLAFLSSIVSICLLLAFTQIKALNAIVLDSVYAQSLGINLKLFKRTIILITGFLAATITAYCGPIAFIGMAVPHLSRIIFQNSNYKFLLPGTILTGAIISLFCDIVAQLPGSHLTLPLNAITSLIGAPIVIWIIFRLKKIRFNN